MSDAPWLEWFDVAEIDSFTDGDREVEFILEGDWEIQVGRLTIDDYFFNGEDEVPVWHVLYDDESIPLTRVKKWRFKEPIIVSDP